MAGTTGLEPAASAVTGQHPRTGALTICDYGTAVLGPLTRTNRQAQTAPQFGGMIGVEFTRLRLLARSTLKIWHRHRLPLRNRLLDIGNSDSRQYWRRYPLSFPPAWP